MDFARKLSFLVFLLCVLISFKNQSAETNRKGAFVGPPSAHRKLHQADEIPDYTLQLRYDYYNESCPMAEQIIRSSVRELYESRPDVAPALLRLVFHDCFVEGCDASILLEAGDGIESEKDVLPNKSLRGYDVIDMIKSELEEACPGVVSCADIIVLAARESVLLAGGPFYPLSTGRQDSIDSHSEVAIAELPSPQDDLAKIIHSFSSKGFDERETVSLLGAHSTGTIHCKFFENRLNNFRGTNRPDPSIDTEFLDLLRSRCNKSHPSLSSSSPPSASPGLSPSASPALSPSSSTDQNSLSLASLSQEPGMRMDYEGPRTGFGMLYYHSLLQGKGLLFVDQQLTAGEETETWVRAYASDLSLFKRDFGLSMIKLSNIQSGVIGQVRQNCRKVN